MARMRKKKNIGPRMKACQSYWFPVPVANRGRWREAAGMPADAPLYLELGCGKGGFALATAMKHPDVCYVAVEKDESVILAAIEKAAETGVKNLFFLCTDVLLIKNYFAEGEADRMYINFCDPWSKRDKPKRRLTYRDYLEMYKLLLKDEGQIHFKTDDRRLFDFSLEEFAACHFSLHNTTFDLHNSKWDQDNIRTEFEQKFADRGAAIHRTEAHKEKRVLIHEN